MEQLDGVKIEGAEEFFEEETEELIGVRVKRAGEIMKILFKFAGQHQRQITVLGIETGDFVNEVYLRMITRKWNEERATGEGVFLGSVIWHIAGNYLTDCYRILANQRKKVAGFVSFEDVVANTDGLQFSDIVGQEENLNRDILLMEIIESVPDTPISRNYDWTWRDLLEFLMDFSNEEIAKEWGMSDTRIRQLKSRMSQKFFAPKTVRTPKIRQSKKKYSKEELDQQMEEQIQAEIQRVREEEQELQADMKFVFGKDF